MVVVPISRDLGNMLRLDDNRKFLNSDADLGCSRAWHKAAQYILEFLQQHRTRHDIDLSTSSEIEDRSARAVRGKYARNDDVGIEDDMQRSGALPTLPAD